MPSIKLKGAKAQEVKSGFEPYDGPTPNRRGFYRSVIKKLQYRRNKNSQSMGFYIVVELEAAAGDPKGHAVFDGYPLFISSIITESADGEPLKEGAQRNLDNFLAALGTGDEPTIVLADGDPEDGVDVKKIGNRNPIGATVNVEIAMETYMGEERPKGQGVYKVKDEAPAKAKTNIVDTLDEDDDLFEEDEAEGEEDAAYDERSAELHAMQIPALRKILEGDYDLPKSGNKEALIERILEHEFSEEDEAEDDEAEEVDEPEDADEVDDEDEPEDDEPEEDEEEEDEDDEAYNERKVELDSFNRIALKKVLAEIAADFVVLKRHTDEQLREQILEVEFGDELPF